MRFAVRAGSFSSGIWVIILLSGREEHSFMCIAFGVGLEVGPVFA